MENSRVIYHKIRHNFDFAAPFLWNFDKFSVVTFSGEGTPTIEKFRYILALNRLKKGLSCAERSGTNHPNTTRKGSVTFTPSPVLELRSYGVDDKNHEVRQIFVQISPKECQDRMVKKMAETPF